MKCLGVKLLRPIVCVKLNVTFCAQIERKWVLSYLRGKKVKQRN